MKFLERALDGKNQVWKYLVVCVGALIIFPLIGQIPLALVVMMKNYEGAVSLGSNSNVMDFSYLGISKNLGLGLVLFSTVTALLLTIPFVRWLHKRTFSEVINGTKRVRLKRCLTGALVWFVVMGAVYAVDCWVNKADYVLQFDLARFIPLFFIVLLFIPFQTTGEEFLFRGYLAQGFAAWTKRRWVALLVPSLLFGLLHVANPEVQEFGFWLSMPQYILFGLIFGLVSILDDGIELAMGIHAANNAFLALFVTHQSSVLQTDAVFEVVNIDPVKDTLLLILMSLVVLAYFAWRYKWDFSLFKRSVAVEREGE
jgi:membrane protease YdiL (CAAX protease family)